jgi:hypothetical protein
MLFSRQSGASCRAYTPPAPLQKKQRAHRRKKAVRPQKSQKCKQLLS